MLLTPERAPLPIVDCHEGRALYRLPWPIRYRIGYGRTWETRYDAGTAITDHVIAQTITCAVSGRSGVLLLPATSSGKVLAWKGLPGSGEWPSHLEALDMMLELWGAERQAARRPLRPRASTHRAIRHLETEVFELFDNRIRYTGHLGIYRACRKSLHGLIASMVEAIRVLRRAAQQGEGRPKNE